MNFEDFRADIESMLNQELRFDLQEYHFEPYSFGNGVLAYRIMGRNHRFVFDGREKELTWMISKSHQKYFGAEWEDYKTFDGLNVGRQIVDDLKSMKD